MITSELIENFSQIIEQQTGSKSQVIPILKQWSENKEFIYQRLLNNKLSISEPISIKITEKQKEFAKKTFIYEHRQYEHILKQIDTTSLITNRLQATSTINNVTFPKGIKITKIFKALIESQISCTILENRYSLFLQTLKPQGQLQISIDPLDYLTMSDNFCSWISCHSFQDGEYRGAPLSLMTDNSTIICYLKTDKPFNFNGVETSNKQWRVLIHFNKEAPYIIFNKQYPFNNKYIMMALIKKLQKLLNSNFTDFNFRFNNVLATPKIKQALLTISDVDEICCNDLMSLNPREDIKVIIPDSVVTLTQLSPTNIGEWPICPTCGKNEIITQGSIQCDTCHPFEYCCNCGNKFHLEELISMEEELYCDSCFDEQFTYCENCGEEVSRFSLENMFHTCIKDEEGEKCNVD